MLSLNLSPNPQPFRQPWRNLITVGRAYDLLRADLLEHLTWLQKEVGYRYCRYHALFHDDMGVVKRLPSGGVVYHWHHVDKVHDALLARGLKPFVELNSMPAALASGPETMFFYRMNITPPKDWAEWGALVEAFARHSIERYGREEVRTWYFEVWNEPNLGGFWTGTQADYWKLYATAAAALKRVDAGLRVGGPATSKAHWIADFIAFCDQNSVPVDFISTHLYPQDEQVEFPDRAGSPHPVGGFFAATVRSVQEIVAASAMPHLEIHWSEWNSQSAQDAEHVTWGENVFVDNAFAGTFIARTCTAIDPLCHSFGWWVASDIFEEGGIPSAPLSCTYGLLTIHGLPKASANAFRLLRRLVGERRELELPPSPQTGRGAVATHEEGHTHLLAWNHAHAELPPPPVWRETLRLPWLGTEPPQVLAARVGPKGGSVYEAWLELGKPANLTPAQLTFLRSRSEPVWTLLPARLENGSALIDLTLDSSELLYLDIAPRSAGAGEDTRLTSAQWDEWDRKMGELSR
jgi:xylan 1,4-beta-xylosidase